MWKLFSCHSRLWIIINVSNQAQPAAAITVKIVPLTMLDPANIMELPVTCVRPIVEIIFNLNFTLQPNSFKSSS